MKKKCKINAYSSNSFGYRKPKGFMSSVLKMISCALVMGFSTISYANDATALNALAISVNQGQTISGNVSDAEGPLAGVTVMIKGTTSGTSTDFDGNYSISVDSNDTVLVFSYIGYATKEVVVGSNTTLNVVLEGDTSKLDEVVVVGYSTKKRGELTGSVSTISSEAIAQTSSKDVAKSLAGRASGLIINDRGGYPGAGNGAGGNTNDDATTILIRGKSTLGNNSPLILIDGIPSGSFSQLAPQDIASLTILKDGAAAIYGSRAANGVILITTQRGKTGKPKINFSTSYNISSFTRQPNLMSSEQWTTYQNEIAGYAGNPLPYSDEDIAAYAAGNDPINFPNTNWADLTFANSSPESRNSLSISGGNEKVKYFVSGDFLDQKGMFKSGALKFKQYQVRSNIDVMLTDKIKLGVDLSGRFGNTQQPGVTSGNIYKLIFNTVPIEVGVYPNGLPARGSDEGNPVLTSSLESGFQRAKNTTLQSKFSFDWDLSKIAEGLSIKSYVGIRKLNRDDKDWYTPWTHYQLVGDEYVPGIGSNQRGTNRILRETFWKFDEQLYNIRLHYAKVFGDHSLNAFVGHERLNSNTREFFAEKTGGFPDPRSGELFQGNNDDRQLSSGTSSEFKRQDYFGSLSYDYKKRYFVDFTIRHDGSSNFGTGKRFGTFPSVAVSWSLANEKFMENVDWLDALKFRASWSEMGNDRIDPNQFLSLYDYGNNNLNTAFPNYYVTGVGGNLSNSYTLNRIANPDVTWETADMKNVGVNFTLFNNKLNGDINYFNQERSGILVNRSGNLPDFIGLQNSQIPAENIGATKSTGWEFELSWADKIGEVGYNIGANFSKAVNEVVSLPEGDNISPLLRQQGLPIDSYVMYATNGVFRDQAQIDATDVKWGNPQPGDINYIDSNEDGVINAEDRVRVGSSNIPQIQYGIYGGINYKAFNLNFLLQGQAEAETLVYFAESQGAAPDFVFNQRWTSNNRNASFPRAFGPGDAQNSPISEGNVNTNNSGFQGADLWYQDASFVRLKEVELGYTLTNEKTKIGGDIKIFARGFNLLTMFSDIYDLGLDPEATGYNSFRNATYTPLKTYTIGLNFSF